MSNRGRHKRKDNIKELLERIKNKQEYYPQMLCYRNNKLIDIANPCLNNVSNEEIIKSWLYRLKFLNRYDKVIIDNLTFVL